MQQRQDYVRVPLVPKSKAIEIARKGKLKSCSFVALGATAVLSLFVPYTWISVILIFCILICVNKKSNMKGIIK